MFSAPPGVTILRAARAPNFAFGRSPSIAYGFGSGFASDIGGIKHSNSFGSSFQIGDAEAYGSGIGASGDNVFAGGVGYAHANPNTYRTAYPVYSTPYTTPYHSYPYNLGYNNFATPQLRNSYGNAISSPQNLGNLGAAFAHTQSGAFGSSASAVNIAEPYQSRHSFRNPGFGGSAVASAVSIGSGATAASSNGLGNSVSLAQTHDGQGRFNSAVSTSDSNGVSTAQTVQQNGGAVQQNAAINGPNFQAAQSNVVNNDDGATAGTYY